MAVEQRRSKNVNTQYKNHVLLSQVVTTPSVEVARALGLWQWIEHEDTMDDVVYVYIYLGDQGMILENSCST